MTNAERILRCLDGKLTANVELTLYGRAALQLGFDTPPAEYARSRDVDVVLWLGQAEALNETTDFWQAIDAVNAELGEQDLYVSHFFTEDQVILRPDWRRQRVRIPDRWRYLTLYRLGNLDLLLSKLMRDDPLDLADACFLVTHGGLSRAAVEGAMREARLPASAEVREQFRLASARLLGTFPPSR